MAVNLRERAARLLFTKHSPGEAVHYRDWLNDVLAAGYEVVGKDPVATFLTNVTRSALVVRGEEPGTYRLEPARASEVRRELGEAQAELADLVTVLAREANPPAELREHRTRLLATIRRLEREVAENERILAPAAYEEPPGDIQVHRRAA